jgi:putative addiction module component (TIGR02574 family)
MSEAATTLLEQLLKLAEADRAAIADRLWESLSDAAQDERTGDPTADPAFAAELERRLAEAHEHPERLLDGEAVMAELRDRFRRKREQ